MNESNYQFNQGGAVAQAQTNTMLRKAYWWMFGALAITGLTAFYVASNPAIFSAIFSSAGVFIALIIAEFALVIGLSAAIHKMSATVATLMFVLYSVVNGVTLSSIFVVYQLGSIFMAFFASAGMFATMAIVGSITKKDLTSIGNLCIMALVGIIIAMIVNLFIHSTTMDLIISCIGVLVFVGLTAFDAQKIKQMLNGAEENETTNKIAILGALSLYLDFINIFLYILRIFGRRN